MAAQRMYTNVIRDTMKLWTVCFSFGTTGAVSETYCGNADTELQKQRS